MKGLLGLVNLYEDETGMESLTRRRPLAAVPFAGRYRLIDFALSNLVGRSLYPEKKLCRPRHLS